MKRSLLFCCLFLAGCQTIEGPAKRANQCPPRVDNPCLPISEQERRARALLAYPDPSPNVGPNVY